MHSPEEDDRKRDEIARRAHERFQKRGGEHGRDQEDWLEAEREISDRRSPEEESFGDDAA